MVKVSIQTRTFNIDEANTLIKKFKGLMFRNEKRIMLFKDSNESYKNFHTFFMRYNLDFFFFNSENKIVKVYRDIPPYFLNIGFYAKDVIEAPSEFNLSSSLVSELLKNSYEHKEL